MLNDEQKKKVVEQLKEICGPLVADIVGERFKALEDTVTKRFERLTEGKKNGHDGALEPNFVGKFLWSFAKAKGRTEKMGEVAGEHWGEDSPVAKSFVSSQGDEGAIFIDADKAGFMIDLLTPRVAVLALGPNRVPMPSGTLEINEVTSDVTADYGGEVEDIPASKAGVGKVRLSSRKQRVLMPVSNDLLKRANEDVAAFLQRLAVRRLAVSRDVALIRGAGDEHEPKGLRNWASTVTAAANVAGAPTITQVLTELGAMIELLEGSDVMMVNPGWIFSTRIKNTLLYRVLTSTTNEPFFLEEMRGGTLLGFPFVATNNVPNNLNVAGSGDDSEIILADFDEVIYGEEEALGVAMSDQAAYLQGATLVSSFSRDETVLRLISKHDLGVKHPDGVTVRTGVRWGA